MTKSDMLGMFKRFGTVTEADKLREHGMSEDRVDMAVRVHFNEQALCAKCGEIVTLGTDDFLDREAELFYHRKCKPVQADDSRPSSAGDVKSGHTDRSACVVEPVSSTPFLVDQGGLVRPDLSGDWYCPACDAYLCWQKVTFYENCANCGTAVEWHVAGVLGGQGRSASEVRETGGLMCCLAMVLAAVLVLVGVGAVCWSVVVWAIGE